MAYSFSWEWEEMSQPIVNDSEVLLPSGVVLGQVHAATECEWRGCCIHHPSDHHMKDWPLNWRDDRRMMERICPHGVGHPDPDGISASGSVHGCDGCCRAAS